MRLTNFAIALFAVLMIANCFLANRKLRLPEPEKKKSQEATAAQIFDYQSAVNNCTRNVSVSRIEVDATKDDFVTTMSDACTHDELIKLSRYWFCFQKQLICPLTWALSYQKGGDNCLPLPKLSEKCCDLYEIEWTTSSGKKLSSCTH